MALFNFLRKTPSRQQIPPGPYNDIATNLIYDLLFCDNIDLFKTDQQPPYAYPFDILFSETASAGALQKIADDKSSDPRVRALAYNKLIQRDHRSDKKEVLAVIIEIGLDKGLDVLASFQNGTARYINQTGKMLIWETTEDEKANDLTKNLFANSQVVVNQLKPWNQPRRPHPAKGNTRITFLVSDGLTFGEGPTEVLFNDPLGGAALTSATLLLKYLTERP